MSQNIKLKTHLVKLVSNQILSKPMVLGKLQPKQLITHHFTLDEVVQAYDTFGDAMKEEALMVIVTNRTMMDKAVQADRMKKTIPFPVNR